MRFKEVKHLIKEQEDLLEVKMTTANLRKLAANIDARAGMEFEMIVPNVAGIEREPELEPDYDMDAPSYSFDNIEDFFSTDGYNSRSEIRRVIGDLEEEYFEWKTSNIYDGWAEDREDFISDYVISNDIWDEDKAFDQARDEIMDEYPDLDQGSEEFNDLVRKRLQQALKEYVLSEIKNDTGMVDDAFNLYSEERDDDFTDEKFLDEKYPMMMDISSHFDLTWPYIRDANEGEEGEVDVETVASDFSAYMGKPVTHSTSYHGARRSPGRYVVEPDGSLDPDDEDDAGLEFVSPPMPIDELIDDLNKVKKWAGEYGCYTNDSTGLHINISVPNYSLSKLDYVKLAILMGDEYVLDLFGRSSNSYAKAAMGKIKSLLKSKPELAPQILEKMRSHMEALATKAIHSGHTDKYTSINTKDGYIEFRSPGGDWLDKNFSQIENTLLRFTVALDAAIDPEKYRKEYLKKLYQFLSSNQNKEDVDIIKLFSDYSAGELEKSALVQLVRQQQFARQGKTLPDQEMVWKVTGSQNSPYQSVGIEVVAKNKQDAMSKARQQWNLNLWPHETEEEYFKANNWKATPLRAVPKQAPEPQTSNPNSTPSSTIFPDRQHQDWKIVDIATGRVLGGFRADGEQAAKEIARERLLTAGFDPEDYQVIPTSAYPQPQQTTSNPPRGHQTFTGRWKVLIGGEQVFTVDGENQGVANAAARQWLNNRSPEFNREYQGREVEVIPIYA